MYPIHILLCLTIAKLLTDPEIPIRDHRKYGDDNVKCIVLDSILRYLRVFFHSDEIKYANTIFFFHQTVKPKLLAVCKSLHSNVP